MNVVYRQTPQWEGQNIGRRLFNKWRPGANPEYITGTKRTDPSKGEPTYVLHAGEMHGIVPGSTYAIHLVDIDEDDSPGFNPRLCNAIVENVGSSLSHLKLLVEAGNPHHMPSVFYGKCVAKGPPQLFVVYCNRPMWFNSIIHPDTHASLGFILISPRYNPQSLDPKQADLRILRKPNRRVHLRKKTGTVVSEFVGSKYRVFSLERAQRRLKDVIRGAICFKLRLSLQQSSSRNREIETKLNTQVWLEVKELDSAMAKPIGGNLLVSSGDQAQKQDIETESVLACRRRDDLTVTLPAKRSYGVVIHNDSDIPLYLYAEWFEPGTLKIDPLCTPAIKDKVSNSTDRGLQVDAPLPKESTLAIGSGEFCTNPLTFGMAAKGASRNIGFIKVYLSPSDRDFKSFVRPSPYAFGRFDPSGDSSNARDPGDEEHMVGDAWIAKTIIIKQIFEEVEEVGEVSSSPQVDPLESRR
ncbi:hypothetical protein BDN72DRAFT_161413 [Pluteus cervinus]|uniref:Uncharacterized protein n=1 Tax=Pluteus cervinus TaxID=181527 RepID=A0ACD2ZY18_9AGAR|nr:hypothetical protein BDN72DRAFT_161413 [Pluteus cervinus]